MLAIHALGSSWEGAWMLFGEAVRKGLSMPTAAFRGSLLS